MKEVLEEVQRDGRRLSTCTPGQSPHKMLSVGVTIVETVVSSRCPVRPKQIPTLGFTGGGR